MPLSSNIGVSQLLRKVPWPLFLHRSRSFWSSVQPDSLAVLSNASLKLSRASFPLPLFCWQPMFPPPPTVWPQYHTRSHCCDDPVRVSILSSSGPPPCPSALLFLHHVPLHRNTVCSAANTGIDGSACPHTSCMFIHFSVEHCPSARPYFCQPSPLQSVSENSPLSTPFPNPLRCSHAATMSSSISPQDLLIFWYALEEPREMKQHLKNTTGVHNLYTHVPRI